MAAFATWLNALHTNSIAATLDDHIGSLALLVEQPEKRRIEGVHSEKGDYDEARDHQ